MVKKMFSRCKQHEKNAVINIKGRWGLRLLFGFDPLYTKISLKAKPMDTERRLLYLCLMRMGFLRPRERLLLANLFSNTAEFLRLTKASLEFVLKRRLRQPNFKVAEYFKQAEQDQRYLTEAGIICTFYGEKNYPPLLAEIYDPPLVLYLRGEVELLLQTEMYAVVGTRQPSGRGRDSAFRLGLELAEAQRPVVSGLAQGIDSAAHAGCISAFGKALAVLGNGIDSVYPKSNRPLAAKILKTGGLIMSEYPPGLAPLKHHFPARNRIISGLAKAVIIVEAPIHSGSLITADYALEQGRELLIHATGLSGPKSAGLKPLLADGARIISSAQELWSGGESDIIFQEGYNYSEPSLNNLSQAELLELELAGRLIIHNGKIIWRNKNGA